MGPGAPGRRTRDRGGDRLSADSAPAPDGGPPGVGEHPRAVLRRWADHGAMWRVVTLTPERAEIDLCACTGEPMDRLATTDPELIAELRVRPSSED